MKPTSPALGVFHLLVPSDQVFRPSSTFDCHARHACATGVFCHRFLPSHITLPVSPLKRLENWEKDASFMEWQLKERSIFFWCIRCWHWWKAGLLAGVRKQVSWEWQSLYFSQQTSFQSLLCIRQFCWPHSSRKGIVTWELPFCNSSTLFKGTRNGIWSSHVYAAMRFQTTVLAWAFNTEKINESSVEIMGALCPGTQRIIIPGRQSSRPKTVSPSLFGVPGMMWHRPLAQEWYEPWSGTQKRLPHHCWNAEKDRGLFLCKEWGSLPVWKDRLCFMSPKYLDSRGPSNPDLEDHRTGMWNTYG